MRRVVVPVRRLALSRREEWEGIKEWLFSPSNSNTFHAADDAEDSFEGDLRQDDSTKLSRKHKNGQNYKRGFTLVSASETQRVSNRPCFLNSTSIFSKRNGIINDAAKTLPAAASLGLLVSKLSIHAMQLFHFHIICTVLIVGSISLHSTGIMTAN